MTYQSVASFETGHIYGTDRPFPILKPGQPETVDFDNVQDPVFDLEMQLGLRIQKYLESNFSEVKRLWFHDDVAPRMKQKISVDSSRWEHFIQVPPEQVKQILELQGVPRNELIVQNEYALIEEALQASIPEIIESVSTSDTWRYDVGRNMLRGPNIKIGKKKKQSRIRLLGYREHADIPSCEALDYTYYKKRLEMSSPTVTLISEKMKGQQHNVRQLFTLTGVQPEVIVIYHDGEKIVDSEYWGEGEYQSLRDDILSEDISLN